MRLALLVKVSGKPPPVRYYAPGYNSTYHSKLTVEQEKSVKATGDISREDKEKGYRLNKKNKYLVNRVDKKEILLLTWEVAKADGLLHTYDLEQNRDYSAEVKFLKSFLANFEVRTVADTGDVVDLEAHEREIGRSERTNREVASRKNWFEHTDAHL